MVSVVKMLTVLEEYTTEEQRSLVCFCGKKDAMQRIFIKKYFLFTVGSVGSIKELSLCGKHFADDEDVETTVKSLPCCGFRCTCKAVGNLRGWSVGITDEGLIL
jgi:hypothetical protein